MPQGIVQAIGLSRSGKPTITVSGQIYSASKVDLSNLQVGDKIEMDTASSVYNGATVWFLNGFKLLEAAIKYPSPTPRNGVIASPVKPSASQGGLSEPERIFSYGVVTEAIKAGLIKEPEQIEKWVCAGKNALRSQGE